MAYYRALNASLGDLPEVLENYNYIESHLLYYFILLPTYKSYHLIELAKVTEVGSYKRKIWSGMDNLEMHFYIYTTPIFHTLHCFYSTIRFRTLAVTF